MRIGNYAAKTFGCLAVIFVSAAAVIGIFLGSKLNQPIENLLAH